MQLYLTNSGDISVAPTQYYASYAPSLQVSPPMS